MITSMSNKLVKQASKLNKRKYRKESKQYLVFGKTLVETAIENKVVDTIFFTEDNRHVNFENKYQVTSQVMKKILCDDTITTTICAICNMVEDEFTFGHVLVLDNIQDPGNLGTMMRSAKAFGVNNVFLSSGTVDVYNQKCLRAMQGVNFMLNIKSGDLHQYLKESNNVLITTYLDEDSIQLGELSRSDNYDIMFGNEGHGLNPQYKKYQHLNYLLDIEYESLNVAIAASIVMHEIKEL